MRRVRRTWPFCVAAGAHAAVLASFAAVKVERANPYLVPADETFDVEAPSSAAAVAASNEPQAATREPPAAASGSLGLSRGTASMTPPTQGATSAREALAPPAASAAPWSFSPTARTDIGVGTYWQRVAATDVPRSLPSSDEAPARQAELRLRDDLEARDVETGHSVASPLVAAAHDAASPRNAPDSGTATVEIVADASGEIVTARVVDASGDPAGWEPVAVEIRRSMAHRPLRVPEGARGIRAHLRIAAAWALPAGNRTSIGAGAAPDEVCESQGATRRCTAGMPGVGGTWGDLSNIGARPSRVVHVQLLDEALL